MTMGRDAGRRALLLAVATLVVVASASVVAVVVNGGGPRSHDLAQPAAGTPGCADVLFLGADGRGETPSSTRVFGPTLDVLYRDYAARSVGSPWDLQTERVAYTSQPLSTLRRSPTAHGLATKVVSRASVKAWKVGVGGATRRAVHALRAAAAACPQQQLVLAGYSQGASVVHRALLALADEPTILRRVTGAVLVGDGDRSRGTAALLSGTRAAQRSGAGVITKLLGGVADVPRAGWTSPVWTVCSAHDLVCDFGPVPFKEAAGVHTSYRSGSPATHVRAIAYRVWKHTTHHPKPTVDPVEVSAEIARPVRVRLAVDIAPKALSYVRWSTRSSLPPGLALTDRGLLSGLPTVTGTWAVPYTVRSVEAPEYGRRVRAVLVITVRPSGTGTISAGGGQTCSVRMDGTAWCWGRNNFGQLGNGTTTTSNVPVQVGTYTAWATISTSGSTTCAVRLNGTLWCWGLNYVGQLGDGTTTTRHSPVKVGTDRTWAAVSNSWFHTCGIRRDGTLWCWGVNRDGQLGDGTNHRRLVPHRVGTGSAWASVSAGGWHTCATRTNGGLWCWGANDFGQLGTGDKTSVSSPVRVGAATAWGTVSASWMHTCALTVTGEAMCWGRNGHGQLGDGTTRLRVSPVAVQGSGPWLGVSTGDSFSCGLAVGGQASCWGNASLGQLGDGLRTQHPDPAAVADLGPAAALDAGWVHACAVQTDGVPFCWGSNENGQLGNGSFVDQLRPVEVG